MFVCFVPLCGEQQVVHNHAEARKNVTDELLQQVMQTREMNPPKKIGHKRIKEEEEEVKEEAEQEGQ